MILALLLQQFLFSVSVSAAPQTMTFEQKCGQPGVIACYGFDQQSELKYNYATDQPACVNDQFIKPRYDITQYRNVGEGNASANTQNGVCMYPIVDTSQAHSGAGSLKFTIPSTSSANTSGNFTMPFKGLGTNYHVPAGQTIYLQFWQYFTPEMLNTYYLPGGGWKQIIIYGNPPNGSNSSGIESTIVNGWLKGIPVMYGQQGHDDYGYQDVRGCSYNFNGMNTYPEPPCKRHHVGWNEFDVAITPGTASCYAQMPVRGNTRVRMWVDGELVVDVPYACMNLSGSDGDGYGAFILTPFQTGKDATQITPMTATWYDDMIISTQPIAMGIAPPVNAPPVANAGPDQTITLPGMAQLAGTASDDGLPSNMLTVLWSSTPGVTFSNPKALNSIASFAAAGTYSLSLTVSDGALTVADSVTITVNPVPTAPDMPPTVQIKSPANGASITGKVTINITANDDVGVTWLELFIGGQSVWADAASSKAYSWNTAPYRGKTVKIEARASDANVAKTSASIVVTVKK